jgi:hypothetical protein
MSKDCDGGGEQKGSEKQSRPNDNAKDLKPTCAYLANCRRDKERELTGFTMTILGRDNLESSWSRRPTTAVLLQRPSHG